MLAATTIYLTPYRSREQIVSGALTFAIVAGCPTVSTPYFYAEDLLASGAGVLVPFDDPAGARRGGHRPARRPGAARAARAEARAVGSELAWPQVGRQTADVLREAVALGPPSAARASAAGDAAAGARLAPADDGRRRRHRPARRRRRARCARRATAPTTSRAWRSSRSGWAGPPAPRRTTGCWRGAWASCATPGAPSARGMRNFMSYDRRWLDEPHGGDHLGRAAWALGEVVAAEPVAALLEPSLILLREMLPALAEQRWPRTMAFAALGLARADPERGRRRRRRRSCAPSPAGSPTCSAPTRRRTGTGPRTCSTYDNARLPQALIAAGAGSATTSSCAKGSRSLDWYAGELGIDGAVPAARRRIAAGAAASRAAGDGDEQPLDAAALVEARGRGVRRHQRRAARARHAVRAFEWFLGRNRLQRVGLRLRHRRLPRRPRRVGRQRQRGRRVDAGLPPGAARPRRRRPSGRRCPNEARAARADRVANPAAPLRARGSSSPGCWPTASRGAAST